VVGAVAVRNLVQVLLVVVLGEVELAGRDDLGGDVAVAGFAQLLAELGGRLLGGRLLLRTVVEDRRTVLGADVVALAHALGRVVRLPEHLDQLGVGDLLRIEHDANRLRVPGPAGADLLVGRVLGEPALVAHSGGDHAGDLPERTLLAPEAAKRELGDLAAGRVRPLQRRAEHLVHRRHWHRLVPARQRVLLADHLRLPEAENAHHASSGRFPPAITTVRGRVFRVTPRSSPGREPRRCGW